jgi:hypothetical protein
MKGAVGRAQTTARDRVFELPHRSTDEADVPEKFGKQIREIVYSKAIRQVYRMMPKRLEGKICPKNVSDALHCDMRRW